MFLFSFNISLTFWRANIPLNNAWIFITACSFAAAERLANLPRQIDWSTKTAEVNFSPYCVIKGWLQEWKYK